MSPNRRIFLNIVATYGRSLYALVIGLFCGRWTLMALNPSMGSDPMEVLNCDVAKSEKSAEHCCNVRAEDAFAWLVH